MNLEPMLKITAGLAFSVTLCIIIFPISHASATTAWDSSGKIIPNKITSIEESKKPRIEKMEKVIPIYSKKAPSEVLANPSKEVLTREFTQENFTILGTVEGLGYDYVTPPDVQLAVGPSEIMEMDNLQGQVWSKSGNPIGGPFDLETFFGTGSDFISDPKVVYDTLSGRWIASILDATQGSVKIAVSDTNNATSGVFCLYSVKTDSSVFPDQPILGVSSDKITISANDFDYQFENDQFWVLNKSDMLSCKPTGFVTKTMNDQFSIHPAQSLSNSTTQYMVDTSHTSTGSFLNVFQINGVPPNPVSLSITPVPVSPIFDPPSAFQEGSKYTLDTGDSRVQDAMWSSGTLWTTFTDSCFPQNDTLARSCLRLVDIDTRVLNTTQDFDYGVAGKYLFYPAIRQMPDGNLFVLYGFSSPSDYPSIGAIEQRYSDAPDSLELPGVIKQGMAPVDLSYGCFSSCRYGDYFGVALDPQDPTTVWGAGEYGTGIKDPDGFGSAWGTEIVRVKG